MNTLSNQSVLPETTLKPPQKKRKRFLRADEADKWQEHFEDLCRFRENHSHCLVPHTYAANPGLGRWVKRQRYEYKLLKQNKVSSMIPERLELLEKIGFVWDSHESAWKEKLQELIAFKESHGTCDIPYYYPVNPQLATWATRQRRQYTLYNKGKASSMTPARIQALENIGFKWKMRVIKKDTDKATDLPEKYLSNDHKIYSDKKASLSSSVQDAHEIAWQSRAAPLPVDLIPISNPEKGEFSETDGRMFLEVLSDLDSQDGSIAEEREYKSSAKRARMGAEDDKGISFHEGILSDVLCDLSVAIGEDESVSEDFTSRELQCSNPEPFKIDYISLDMELAQV